MPQEYGVSIVASPLLLLISVFFFFLYLSKSDLTWFLSPAWWKNLGPLIHFCIKTYIYLETVVKSLKFKGKGTLWNSRLCSGFHDYEVPSLGIIKSFVIIKSVRIPRLKNSEVYFVASLWIFLEYFAFNKLSLFFGFFFHSVSINLAHTPHEITGAYEHKMNV